MRQLRRKVIHLGSQPVGPNDARLWRKGRLTLKNRGAGAMVGFLRDFQLNVGCCTSDAVAGGATRQGFYLRFRRYLILRYLMHCSLDIPIFHTEMAGGFSSSSRALSPSPLSCLYHGLSGHSKGQSKHQRRYICELCRLWEGEEDRGGRCLLYV
jgi:hypothetical protein